GAVVLVALGIAAREGLRVGEVGQEGEQVVGVDPGGIDADVGVNWAVARGDGLEALPQLDIAGGVLGDIERRGSGAPGPAGGAGRRRGGWWLWRGVAMPTPRGVGAAAGGVASAAPAVGRAAGEARGTAVRGMGGPRQRGERAVGRSRESPSWVSGPRKLVISG